MRRSRAAGILAPSTPNHDVYDHATPTIVLEIAYVDRARERREITARRTIIGRESGDIVLHDPESSALHAEIDCNDGHVIVRDLGSFNGTLRGDKRLPQFALFAGQTFRCGKTDITLIEVRGGAQAPPPGRTAISTTPLTGASATLPGQPTAVPTGSAATLPGGPKPTARQTLVRGSAPLDRTRDPTVPASTLVGVAPPASTPKPAVFSGPTLPGDPTPATAHDTPSTASAPPMAGPFRAPVANAVIKPRGAAGSTPPRSGSAADDRRRLGTIFAWTGMALGCLGALIGLVFLVYTLVAGRQLAFVERIASQLPRDTVGFVALRSPRASLDLFGDEVEDEVRHSVRDILGLDPFDAESWTDAGIDLDAPVTFALLHATDEVFALSLGVDDPKRVRQLVLARLHDASGSEDLRWVERELGKAKVEWLDEPFPLAAFEREKRLSLVWSTRAESADAVGRQIEAMAELGSGTRLADRPGFAALVPPDGETLLFAYLDGASARASIPGGGLEQMAMRTALADLDGLGFAVSQDGSSFHLTAQAILREGADALALAGERRSTKGALRRVPAPVLAELDAAFDPAGIDRAIASLDVLGGSGMRFIEQGVRDQLGVELRSDVLRNLSGDLGVALVQLPTTRSSDDIRVMTWVGVADERKAVATAERIYGKTHGVVGARTEQIAGTTVYLFDGPPRMAAFVFDEHVWIVLGEVELRPLLEGTAGSFLDAPRHPAIGEALRPGGSVAGFVDVRQLVAAIEPLLGEESSAADERTLATTAAALEIATFRAWTRDRTMVSRVSVHSAVDEALPTLVRAAMRTVGTTAATAARQAARRRKCAQLLEHVQELAARGPDPRGAIEREVLEACSRPETSDVLLDCWLRAEGLETLRRCDQTAVTSDAHDPEGDVDPLPVPYVDDIWPKTRHDDGSSTPARDVNYAIDLGRDPPLRGPDDALVTIVEYGDFECPYCRQVAATLDEVLAEHGRDVRLVFRHNPLPGHPNARLAARAAIAAEHQGEFWPMHDKLFDHPHELSEENVRKWAGELGLDLARFDRDYFDAATDRRIDEDIEAARKFAATGTPTFFVNGRYLPGAQPLAAFAALIREEKARAETFVARRGNTRKHLYRDMIAHFAPDVPPPPTPPPTTEDDKRYLVSSTDLPRRGATSFARVQIIACSDFDCPFCARVLPTIDQVLDTYPTQVAFHFAHNPLPFHKGAEPAARAAIAADRQDKFWEMHDKLFEHQKLRTDHDLETMARDLGLDIARWKKDMRHASTTELIEANKRLCNDNDARGTPSFFINGRLVTGAQPFARFQAIIDEELAGGGGI